MRVFISWSGTRSKRIAQATSEWLRSVNHKIEPWLSEAIPPGAKWSDAIGTKLKDARLGIVCITPENIDAPWMVFEAGALSNRFGDARVVPLLLDMSSTDLTGPIGQFQGVTITRENMRKLAQSINDLLGRGKLPPEVLSKSVSANWRTFSEEVENARVIPLESASIRNVLKTLRHHGLPEPSDGRSLNFNSGFESHSLYDAIFSLAKQRLYIFGRKNRKVFDKEHDQFFQRLPAAVAGGFDFRCLFLSPAAPKAVISDTHADPDFKKQLQQSIENAKVRLRRHRLNPMQFCRLYSTYRPHAVIVIDDLVLFAPTGFDSDGKPKALTRCPFKLLDIRDSFANELLTHVLSAWEQGKPMAL